MIVEASLNHPESVNRTHFDCIENGLPSVCMDLTLCFSYKGKEVPGYIGKGTLTKLIECVLYPLSLMSSFEPSLCLTTEDCFRAGESSLPSFFPIFLDALIILTYAWGSLEVTVVWRL